MREVRAEPQLSQFERQIHSELEAAQATEQALTRKVFLEGGILQLTSTAWAHGPSHETGHRMEVAIETGQANNPPLFTLMRDEVQTRRGTKVVTSGNLNIPASALPRRVVSTSTENDLYRSVLLMAYQVQPLPKLKGTYVLRPQDIEAEPRPLHDFIVHASGSLACFGTYYEHKQSIYAAGSRVINIETTEVPEPSNNLGHRQHALPRVGMRLVDNGVEHCYRHALDGTIEVATLPAGKTKVALDPEIARLEASFRRPTSENIGHLMAVLLRAEPYKH